MSVPVDLFQSLLSKIADKIDKLLSNYSSLFHLDTQCGYDALAVLLLRFRCSNAVYTRLIFDDVVLWRSYFRRHMTYLAPGVDACIQQLLERTEVQHGRLLVSHAFAYITVSKEGLTESEIEDVLSLDEQVGHCLLKSAYSLTRVCSVDGDYTSDVCVTVNVIANQGHNHG